MPKYRYLVVEGPHDVEFVYRLLRPFGLERVRMLASLDPFFVPLVPRKFPQDDDDLQKRIPVPLFLQNQTHVVAVHNAGGDTRLVQVIEENAITLNHSSITGIGILLDSDDAVPAQDRYQVIKDMMTVKGFHLPAGPGDIVAGVPKFGAFVLPDNTVQGTLEELLLDSAATVYPNLLASAQQHVQTSLSDPTLTNDDKKDIEKPAGKKKAIVGAMASILRPGKAVQVSIQDNRWFRDQGLVLPRVWS